MRPKEDLKFMLISLLTCVRNVEYLLCVCSAIFHTKTIFIALDVDKCPSTGCTSEIYTVLLGSGAKRQVLFLRAVHIILIEVRVLSYSTEMPSWLKVCPQKVVILVFDRAFKSERCMRDLGKPIVCVYSTVSQISMSFLHRQSARGKLNESDVII